MTPDSVATQIHKDNGANFTTGTAAKIARGCREFAAFKLEEIAGELERTTYLRETVHMLRERARIIRGGA
jgi:hypothetical protein